MRAMYAPSQTASPAALRARGLAWADHCSLDAVISTLGGCAVRDHLSACYLSLCIIAHMREVEHQAPPRARVNRLSDKSHIPSKTIRLVCDAARHRSPVARWV